MKLDKVHCCPLQMAFQLTGCRRTTAVQSKEKNSCHYHKCRPIHWRRGTHLSHEVLAEIAPLTHLCRMIAIFDEDGGGDVDFQEFVLGLSAFSSKGNKEEKLKFAFKVYDIDRDGYISNGELFIVLKMMVGSNLKDQQLQQIVDKTIMEADKDGDGKISFEEFTRMVENTDVSMSMTLGEFDLVLAAGIELMVSARPILVSGGAGYLPSQTVGAHGQRLVNV